MSFDGHKVDTVGMTPISEEPSSEADWRTPMTKDVTDMPYSEPDHESRGIPSGKPEVDNAFDKMRQVSLRNSLIYLKDICGTISQMHGFWINKDSPDRLLMLMVDELSEAHEDLRNGKDVHDVYYEKKSDGSLKPCGFGVELADCVIRIFDAAAQLDIDIATAIMEKIEYNRSRPYLHGRKF